MRALWIAVAVIATLGSLFPFNFFMPPDLPRAVVGLGKTLGQSYGLSDFVGNVILFLPFGFAGILSAKATTPRQRQVTIVFLWGFALALGLQLAQIFLPTRDENLIDVVWNLAGVALGAGLARSLAFVSKDRGGVGVGHDAIVAAALLGAFLVGRLMPFVPSLDVGSIARSVRPLLGGEWSFASIAGSAAMWLMAALLYDRLFTDRRAHRWIIVVFAAVLTAEVLVVFNVVRIADVAGAILAAALWTLFLRHRPSGGLMVAAFLFVTFIASSLTPLQARALPSDFNWMPFHGFLHGSMFTNAQAAATKLFVFGSLIYCLRLGLKSHLPGVILIAVTVASIEALQTRLVGHTPEITDVVLVLAAAAAIALLARELDDPVRHAGVVRRDGKRSARRRGADGRKSIKLGPGWVEMNVALPEEEVRFIDTLRRTTRRSRSRAVRGIVARFLDECDDGNDAANRRLQEAADAGVDRAALPKATRETLPIRLRRSQLRFLASLASALGVSPDAVVVQIVSRYRQSVE